MTLALLCRAGAPARIYGPLLRAKLSPWVEPEDVAGMVLYLVSDKARYVTGAQFTLDAGLLTR